MATKKTNSKKILTEDTFNANGNSKVESEGTVLTEEVKEETITDENPLEEIETVNEENIETFTEVKEAKAIEEPMEVVEEIKEPKKVVKTVKRVGSHDENYYL